MRSKATRSAILAVAAILTVWSCTQPLGTGPGAVIDDPGTGSSAGSIVISIPTIGAPLADALGMEPQTATPMTLTDSGPSRALLYATGVEARLYDSGDTLLNSI